MTEKKVSKTTKKATTSKKKTATTKKKVATASKKIEKQFDEAMQDTQELLEKKVSPKAKKTVKKVTKKAEAVAATVEDIGEEVESITDSIFPSGGGTVATFDAEYTSKISRLFVFRFLWTILQGPIIAIRSLWICLVSIVHWVSMFLTGKRTKSLRKKQIRYAKHVIAWKSYMNGLTDARPEIIHPEI